MTFSIVARTAGAAGEPPSFGIAVASKFLAVGAMVPAADPARGAVATQAMANLGYKRQTLRLLGEGLDAGRTVRRLVDADDEREHRQVGVVDAAGRAASFTGRACHPWAGGRTGDGYAIQGNILVGENVVDAMERAWHDSAGETLAVRLVRALAAGDREGGDRRGRQSAALLVTRAGAGYGGLDDVAVDLRVDDHADPVTELRRLLDLHELYFGRPDPATLLPLEGPLAEEVGGLLAGLGHDPGGAAGGEDGVEDGAKSGVESALASWAGVENYEMRLVPGRIDPLVLERLRLAAAASRGARS